MQGSRPKRERVLDARVANLKLTSACSTHANVATCYWDADVRSTRCPLGQDFIEVSWFVVKCWVITREGGIAATAARACGC